jgi:hypothetical protein
MSSVKSHIQPKFFLKGFLAKKDNPKHADCLYVYKKGVPFKTDGKRSENNPAKVGLDNIAFVNNFYSFLKDDGTEDPVTYENKLSIEIEGPANPVLNKLRSIRLARNEVRKISDYLSSDEKTRFARYVAAMCARGTRNRRWFFESLDKTINDANQTGYSFASITQNMPQDEIDKLEAYAKSVDPKFDKATGRLTFPGYMEKFKEKSSKDKSYPESIFRGIDKLEPAILNLKWQIRTTPLMHKFFTGDDPVYWTNLREPNPLFLFPIATNVIFVASADPKFQEMAFHDRDPKFFYDVRKYFIEKCTELYFSREARWLVDHFNKH